MITSSLDGMNKSTFDTFRIMGIIKLIKIKIYSAIKRSFNNNHGFLLRRVSCSLLNHKWTSILRACCHILCGNEFGLEALMWNERRISRKERHYGKSLLIDNVCWSKNAVIEKR